MADFNSHIITNAGRNLLARALAGEGKVLFTKAAFGDQKHSGNLREVTELKNKKLDLNVMNIRNDNGTAVLTVQISNENVEQSFQTEEFGVYAKIEGDITEILYSYTTAVSADTFPNNRLGKTYESIQDIYMAISSDIEAEIYVRDGVIYLTRDIANQVYTETGLTAVGTLKGRNNLEADKQYLADNGHWYKNIGGNRTWEATSGTPDEQLIPITWKYLYESLNNKENQLIQNLNGILGQNNGEFPVEQAVAGNVYYFPRNQKYYYCLKSQTSRVSVPNADFEELSIYQNRKKLENLYKDFIKSGNWYYKQISSNFYMMFGWFQDVPTGETYYNLPISTSSEYINSIVISAQTGTGGEKPITSYIKNRKIYLNNQNRTRENYSIFAIVQVGLNI
ncbi:phage tail protein [Fusobacterium polymorphum]|uniref:hypothetical protein n=1 Tax=Fusobacterium nucleatum subsp. polymorphum TaxID=76857 RepID=UPI0032493945